MEQIINWFITNWTIILLAVENLVLLLVAISKLTKSTADDAWVIKFKEILKKLGLYKGE
jgi:uncharacterized membrane protein